MRQVKRFRLYDKYNVDLWGQLAFHRTKRFRLQIYKMLYRKRKLFGNAYKDKLNLLTVNKPRRGFGRRRSLYKKQMQEKQKLRYFYGFARDKQVKRFYCWARAQRGIVYDNFAGLLESRVLSILYRAGFVSSMRTGNQVILHHGVLVNGKRIRRYNFTLVPGQIIEFTVKDLKRLLKLRKKYTPGIDWSIRGGLRRRKKKKVWAHNRRRKQKIPANYSLIRKGKLTPEIKRRAQIRFGISFWKLKRKPLKVFMRPPNYLEVNKKLIKVMLVYRPKASEVYYPFNLELNDVIGFYS
jgi:ribosomal protein S4